MKTLRGLVQKVTLVPGKGLTIIDIEQLGCISFESPRSAGILKPGMRLYHPVLGSWIIDSVDWGRVGGNILLSQ